ncbi:transcriptional regulator [Hafnia alvei]|uniref:antitermination protein N n=1 Tax=Hafnia alvei TaxID=569 RepID=UPI001F262C47|nr:antitermination protein N [Hafnia alvei]MCE9874248.1 transcriptional regulator [Hafnia alvei]
MDAQARRREKRKEKQEEWKRQNPTSVGIRAKQNELLVVELNRNPVDRVDKSLFTTLPRGGEKEPEIPHDDVMHRVVNHAHQRNSNKKW